MALTLIQQQLGDLESVIKSISAQPDLNQWIDLSKIGIFGFSFGGATAGLALSQIPEVKVAMNIDGSMFINDIAYEKTSKNFLYCYSNPFNREEVKSDKLLQVFPNLTKYDFGGLPHFEYLSLTLAGKPNSIVPTTTNPRVFQDSLSEKILDFFTSNLKID